MHKIDVVCNCGEQNEEKTTINTNGYLILYLVGDKVRTSGNISLASLAPYLLQGLASKFKPG